MLQEASILFSGYSASCNNMSCRLLDEANVFYMSSSAFIMLVLLPFLEHDADGVLSCVCHVLAMSLLALKSA